MELQNDLNSYRDSYPGTKDWIIILVIVIAICIMALNLQGLAKNEKIAFPNYPNPSDNYRQESISTDRTQAGIRSLTIYQMVFSTLPLIIGLIHLMLYLFFRQAKENLYFAAFLFFYALAIFFDYQNSIYSDLHQTLLYIRIHRATQPFFFILALRFVYSLFYTKLPKRFYFYIALVFIAVIPAIYSPSDGGGYMYFRIAAIPVNIEIIGVIVWSLNKKMPGAKLVAFGFFTYFIFGLVDTIMDSFPGLNIPFRQMENPYAFGTVAFLISMSAYLAKRYAETQRIVSEKEIERRLLLADNARKTQELLEARNLQLSMLPQCNDRIPGISMCFHMTPANEVGGDYYDYQFDEEGSLVLAIGDATGHGMKAGIMVAAVKSLFQTTGKNPDIAGFFNSCTSTIKQMHMGNLFMALAIIRLKGDQISASAAGMPPILIYRSLSDEIEEIVIKGPPLGGFANFPYSQKTTKLHAGDIILLMSDGFPELFDEASEILGYSRVKEIFKSIIGGTPTEIVAKLKKEADKWRGNREQEDDITFIVIKKERHSATS